MPELRLTEANRLERATIFAASELLRGHAATPAGQPVLVDGPAPYGHDPDQPKTDASALAAAFGPGVDATRGLQTTRSLGVTNLGDDLAYLELRSCSTFRPYYVVVHGEGGHICARFEAALDHGYAVTFDVSRQVALGDSTVHPALALQAHAPIGGTHHIRVDASVPFMSRGDVTMPIAPGPIRSASVFLRAPGGDPFRVYGVRIHAWRVAAG
jgi:hypothetical protein